MSGLLFLVLGEVRGQVEAALAAEEGEGELELECGKHGVEASKGLCSIASTVRATQPRRIPLHRRATSLEIRDLVEDICKRSEVFLMILLECATNWL